MKRRLLAVLALSVAGIVSSASLTASPAAAATIDQKVAVMTTWSQATAASYNAWNGARQNQGAWASYGFDWSTDFCSASPDQPLGFDFRLSCHRHDFGYRNFKAVGRFPANKSRIDDSFYRDLKAKCATYNAVVRPACTSLAWTYYQAVVTFGNLVIRDADLDRAADIKERALQNAAKTGAA